MAVSGPAPVSPAAAPPGPGPGPGPAAAPSRPAGSSAAAPVRPAASSLSPKRAPGSSRPGRPAASLVGQGLPARPGGSSGELRAPPARSGAPPPPPAALTGSALVVAPPLLRLGHGRSGARLGSAPLPRPLSGSRSLRSPPARESATISRWKSRMAFYSNASARPTSRAGAAEVIGESRRRTNRRRRQKSPWRPVSGVDASFSSQTPGAKGAEGAPAPLL